MVVDSSNDFLLTLQGILNPGLSLIFGKMQVVNNIPDFRVSYYCGMSIVKDTGRSPCNFNHADISELEAVKFHSLW